jgi:superfamily II DNA/RNA helicase
VQQSLILVSKDDKREALLRLIASENVKNALIFCNRKRDVDILAKSLVKGGYNAAALHGDMAQAARMETLARFKGNEITFLVCSDVAARGLDIQGLSHVFNYDVPMHAEDYVHRIGRTGRAGLTGRALTLATGADSKYLAAIVKLIGREIPAVSIEGLAAPTHDAAAEERPTRSRGGRSRTATRREKPAETSAKVVPIREPRPEPAANAEPAARALSERPARAERAPHAPRREASEPRERRPERRHERDDLGPPVVGLGDHMPAFLTRPVRPAKA